jgi:hypothetical protein
METSELVHDLAAIVFFLAICIAPQVIRIYFSHPKKRQ